MIRIRRFHVARSIGVAATLALVSAGCTVADASEHGGQERVDVAATSPAATVLSPQETVELLEREDDVVLLDVRTPPEVADGALKGATVIDLQAGDFAQRAGELDPDATYAIYCRSGNRSAQAAEILRDLGFTDLYDAGAFVELAAVGLPTTR